jgi:arginine/lysine/ornithine decarboxylase
MGSTYDGFLINLEPIRKWMQTDEFREKNKGLAPPIFLDLAWSAKSIAMKVCEGAFTKQMQHCDGWLTSIHKTLPSSFTSSILVFHHKYARGIAKDFFTRFNSSLNATWQRSCSTSFRPWMFQELGMLGYAFNPKSTWRKLWEADLVRIKEFQEILKRGFETFGDAVVLLCDEHIQQYPSISAMCPWRINIYFDAEKIGFSGIEFASRLEQEGIVVVEKATQFTILALPPIGFSRTFSEIADLEVFAQQWNDVLKDLSHLEPTELQFVPTATPAPIIAKVPSEAFKDARMMISLEDSLGRTAGNAIAPYPPGVPIIASGEIISPAHVAAIKSAVSNHILFKTKLYFPADALVFSGVDDIKVEVLI